MTPFQQFSVWLSRASVAKRTSTGIAVAVALALVGWLVTPPKHADSTSALLSENSGPGAEAPAGTTPLAGPTTTGATGAAAPGGANAGPGGTTVTAGTAAAGAPTGTALTPGARPGTVGTTALAPGGTSRAGTAATGVKPCPATVDSGTTNSTIRIAVTLVDLAGANEAVGLPTPKEQQEDFQWNFDAINARGGAACRRLVGEYYIVNPVDTSGAQSICLKIAASKPFMVLESGVLTTVGAGDCIPEHKIPLVGQFLNKAQIAKYYPYYLTGTGVAQDSYHDAVRTFAQMGAFTPAQGYKKMGLLYHNCHPELVAAMKSELAQVGVKDIVTYSLGCPPADQDTPADVQQAAISMKQAGVTTITTVDYRTFAGFTKAAAQQQYKPHYYITDITLASLSDPNGAAAPDPDNFDGSINVLGGGYGEQTTPGFKPSAPTAACNKLFAAKGRPTVYKQKAGYGGVACAQTHLAELLINHAPSLRKSALASGMASMGLQQFSYPYGLEDFANVPKGAAWGRLYTRTLKFFKTTKGYHVLDGYQKPFA